jgi:cephalosporin-C deacetylase-like acetyl esterase
MGHSRGASIAMIAGANNPYVKAFCAVMPSMSSDGFITKQDIKWKESGLQTYMRDLPPGDGNEVKQFNLPYSFFEDEQNYRVDENIMKSTKPKLFFLGTKDTLAPPERVRKTFEILSEPKELHLLDSDHDYRYHDGLIQEVNRALGIFLTKHGI